MGKIQLEDAKKLYMEDLKVDFGPCEIMYKNYNK